MACNPCSAPPAVILASLLLGCTAEPARGIPALDRFTAAGLEDATRRLTDLGPRPGASPAEIEARDAGVDLLRELGLQPELHPFTWEPWRRGPASIEIDGQRLDALALSPSLPASLRAPLVDGSSGEIRDAIAIYRSTDGSRAEQFAQAAFGGAAAMIRATDDLDHDGEPLVEVGHTLTGSNLPSVAVDRATGDRLAAQVGAEIELLIESSLVSGHESHNIFALLPGESDRMVLLTAHYDSWDQSESAIDNALGVGTLILLADQAARAPSRELSIGFLLTSGEEQGVTGALEWATQHEDLIPSMELVLNLDIPWASEGRYLVSTTDPVLTALALERALEEGLDPVDAGIPGPASDHLPFQARGVDAAWLTRWPDRHYHTTADTADAIDWEEALAAARVNLALLQEVAGFP